MLPNSSDAADVNVGIEVNPFLSMTVSPTVAMTTTPSQSGTVTTGDITTNISTNNATGYTLSLNAKAAANVDLVHSNGTNKILNSTNTSAAALANNTWGYNTKTGAAPTTFLSIPTPTTPATLATTTSPSTDNRTLTIAVKADTTIPAGAYKSTLTLTAVANYVPDPPLPYAGLMQTITTANCPTEMSRANDARDNASYIVQKMADGKCWMLTNLAYGGGGTNTYGDTKSITLNSTNTGYTYTAPQYYIPTGSNRTTGTTDPSTSTNGTGQYGYLYNWCAAMGAQTSTSACANADTPAPDTSISICPSGWRLPVGGYNSPTNDLEALNDAENNGSTSNSSGLLSSWLGQYSGSWSNGFNNQGSDGIYWSSTQLSSDYVYMLSFFASFVNPGTYDNYKYFGHAVRCIAV